MPAISGDLTTGSPPPRRQTEEIPIRLYQGYLVMVDGRIGNLDHQNLLLDTGTSPSMVAKSVAAKMSLQSAAGRVALFNKDLAAETVVLPEIQLGPIRRTNLPVIATDFSRVESELKTHIDAVVGLDVLGTTSFTVDYQKRQMLFHASTERHFAAFTEGPQFISVELKTGNRQLRLLLDTGTARLVLFSRALRHLDYGWTALSETGQNISGAVSYGTVILPEARVGKEDVGPQRVSVVTTQQNVDADFDGLIGLALLRAKRISFDFEHQILGWSN
jgi:hypothetical protein